MKREPIAGVDFKRDLQEISLLVQEYVDTTYLSQIYNQINTYKRQCEKVPPKEIQLIKAVMPFIEDENKERFVNLMEMMTYSQMIKNMLSEYKGKSLLVRDEKKSYDDMHQMILVLFLYKAILWAEQYK